MSPVEFRERNLLRDGDDKPLGGVLRHVRAVDVLKRGAAAIGWENAKKRGVGRGLAVSERGTGSGRAVVAIELDRDGAVTVHTGVAEVGTGSHTVLREVPAIANAVEDAIGVRIFDLPVTAEKVLEGILQGWNK